MTTEPQVTPLQARIAEVAQYEANIALYQTILATLPTEYPERLLQYKGSKNQHEVIALVDSDDVELLSKLWYADDCAKAVRTETLELTKARAILDVLQA
jgi:predicted oxidoreductase